MTSCRDDSVYPHTTQITCAKIEELASRKIPHPASSPDLAQSYYHQFRSLQQQLNVKELEISEVVGSTLSSFFASKSKEFYKHGTEMLIRKWLKVIENKDLASDKTSVVPGCFRNYTNLETQKATEI